MNKEVADKWVKALRSGEFKQGSGQLETLDGRFCCLGVLCKIASRNNIEVEFIASGKLLGSSLYLQPNVKSWAGMVSNSGQLTDSCALTSLNDQGASFEEIADVIEKDWEKL